MRQFEQDSHDKWIIDALREFAWDTIEALTNAIASVIKSDDDDLHDRENWF